jgi:hypothetical protein
MLYYVSQDGTILTDQQLKLNVTCMSVLHGLKFRNKRKQDAAEVEQDSEDCDLSCNTLLHVRLTGLVKE